MTNDKTVTMSRELAQRIFDWCDGSYGGRIINEMEELRAVLAQEAGPVVERQPVAYLDERGKFVFIGYDALRSACWVDADNRAIPDAWQPVYTSPPAPVAVVPDGWKLVPLSPTVEMRNAFAHQIVTGDFNEETLVGDMCGGVYTAMLAASPDACLDKVKELNQ